MSELYRKTFSRISKLHWGFTFLCIELFFALDAFAQTAPAAPVQVDTSAIKEATCWLLYFQEGSWGALLVAASGLGAVVSFATGMYRAALNCVAVAAACWLIRPITELLFGVQISGCAELMKFPG